MAAPFVSALAYFLAPRVAGALADKAMEQRYMSLAQQGNDPTQDTLLNMLALVPRQSGVESTLDTLRNLYDIRNAEFPPYEPFDERSMGASVTRELPGGGALFLSPMEDFLRYGGRDDDAGGRYYMAPSYGQTDQPAPEIRFDQPPGGAYGGLAALIRSQHAKRQR